MADNPHIKLKVAEAVQDDVNKGIVRIDSNFMRDIDVRPGDVVLIKGNKETVGIADRAYPGDIGLNIIRMDGLIRRNGGTGIGEVVNVYKAEVKEAKKVVIAPTSKDILIRASEAVFRSGLLGRALMKGDIISLGGTRRRRSTMSQNPFFNDIFNMLNEDSAGFGFSEIKFKVASTSPKGAVVVSEHTEVEFNPEPIEEGEERSIDVTYEDIGGLEDEISKIREMVELPLKHPEIFEKLGIEAPKGVLLHGPPGTGKTLLAKAVANETNSHFLLINGPEIMSKYYGQSEENLRKKFEEAEKNAPSIIFIDEIDAIASKREEAHGEVERRVVAQLLAMMDGLKTRGKVVVIAATNIPNALDPALRRPGRFDREIDINVPGKEGRLNILKIHTRNMPLLGSVHPSALASETTKLLKNYLQTNAKSKEDLNKELEDLKKKAEETSMLSKIRNKLTNVDGKVSRLENLIKNQDLVSKIINKLASMKKSIQSIEEAERTRIIDDVRNTLTGKEKTEQVEEVFKMLEDLQKEGVDIYGEAVKSAQAKGVEKDLEKLAGTTHGFVGADLAALAKESAMNVLRRVLPDLNLKEDKAISKEVLEKLYVTKDDFEAALRVIRPSALREVLIEKPNVKWKDIGGLEDVKQELIEAVEWPLKTPEAFTRLGTTPPSGILIYGPPGTGKTLLAKAVASESQANFILVRGPELISKWVGESEKGIRKIFQKARQVAPAIVFFDEIDSIAPSRGGNQNDNNVTERVVNQLLTEMNGLEDLHDVVVIGATNRPDILDTALLRPGRFDRIILTPGPDEKSRLEIFKIHTKGMPLDISELESKNKRAKDLREEFLIPLAKSSEGYVGADIEGICREAAILALRENINAKVIKSQHFNDAILKVRPSITKDIEKAYEQLREHFRSAKAKQMATERPSYMG